MQKLNRTLYILFSLVIFSYGQGKFGVSIKSGAGIPVYKLADDFNIGYIFEGTIFWNVRYDNQLYFTSGYQNFGFSDSRTQKDFKVNNPELTLEIDVPVIIVPIVLGGKYYFPINKIRPFVNFEIGYNYYSANIDAIITGGDSDIVINETESGWRVAYNFGLGVDINVSRDLDITFLSRYHFSEMYEPVGFQGSQYLSETRSRQYISILGGINYYFL